MRFYQELREPVRQYCQVHERLVRAKQCCHMAIGGSSKLGNTFLRVRDELILISVTCVVFQQLCHLFFLRSGHFATNHRETWQEIRRLKDEDATLSSEVVQLRKYERTFITEPS